MKMFLRWLQTFVGIGLCLMIIHVAINIILRVSGLRPLKGTVEMTSDWYMIVVVFGGIAICSMRNEQIDVTIIERFLNLRWIRRVRLFGATISVLFLGYFSYGLLISAVRKTIANQGRATSLGILPLWPFSIWAAIMTIVATIATMVTLISIIRKQGN